MSANTDLSNASGTIALYSSDGLLYLLPQHTAGQLKNVFTLSNADLDRPVYFFGMSEGTVTWDKLMVLEGDWTDKEIPAYSDWFAGLKNASFKGIISTGRNLIDLSGVSLEKTVNGVTFTKLSDGQYRVTGTIADPSQGASPTVNINPKKVYPAGVYSTARYYIGGKDIDFFVSAYSAKTGAVIRNIDGANVNINEDFVIRSAGIYVNRTITGAIDLTVSTMLNIGASALPYEPYHADTSFAFSAPQENGEWNTLNVTTGKIEKQWAEKVFDGTETFVTYNPAENNKQEGYTVFVTALNPKGVSPEGGQSSIVNSYPWVRYGYERATSGTCQSTNSGGSTILIKQNQFSTIAEWKSHLAARHAAGNPLTVRYKTAEVTETDLNASSDRYLAWKGGSETIVQGEVDNSEYGAENTVTQEYFTITGGTTNGN